MAKKYIIEVYELHAQRMSVEADSAEEALELLRSGGADIVEDGLEFIETADRYSGEGMPDGIRSVEEEEV